jgi:hypothetical protein
MFIFVSIEFSKIFVSPFVSLIFLIIFTLFFKFSVDIQCKIGYYNTRWAVFDEFVASYQDDITRFTAWELKFKPCYAA